VLIYAKTIFAAKIIAQREHPGYTAIKVDGIAVIPSPNDQRQATASTKL
jgi:molybdopterin biosynthesis enzyme